jgi:hypothetical protein
MMPSSLSKIMRKLLKYIVLSVFCFACQKDNFNLSNPDVDLFVAQLKNGSYDCYKKGDDGGNLWLLMPEFNERHIPELLKFAKDTTHIFKFPVNPVSSLSPFPYGRDYFILGECLLSIIEGIRKGVTFPSLAPYLRVINPELDTSGLNGEEILQVWELYNSWWESNRNSDWQNHDPLTGTNFKW